MKSTIDYRSIIAIGIYITIALGLYSCTKFLDKKSNASQTVPKSLSELKGLFNDLERMNFNVTPALPETASDNYFIPESKLNTLSSIRMDNYIWKSFEKLTYANDWSSNYFPVFNANYALSALNDIPRNQANAPDWDEVKGNALFYRAYSFLNLAWEFAKAYDETTAPTDLGIVLRLGTDFNAPSKRASLRETYDQIISDAKESVLHLPDQPGSIFKPSRAASYGLLARAYLSMREYDSAGKYSALCYNLHPALLDFNNLDLTSNTPFSGFKNPELIFYTEMVTGVGIHFPYSGALVDSQLVSSYQTGDLRRAGYFKAADNYYYFNGAYTAYPYYQQFTGIATDEIILITAECLARNSKLTESAGLLNLLLQSRWDNNSPFKQVTPENKDELLSVILEERRKELLFRGLRWMDIKRLNKEGRNISLARYVDGKEYKLSAGDSRFALPIPNDIIIITGIEQNK